MTVIHMDTEIVRALVSKIQNSSLAITESTNSVMRVCEAMDWQGMSQMLFMSIVAAKKMTMSQLSESLEELALQLQQEIEQWEDGANYLGDGLGHINIFLPGDAYQFGDHVWVTDDKSSKLANMFAYFTNTEEGRDLITDAYAAGLLFVIIENGKEVGWLGDPNGKRMEIKWENLQGVNGHYIPDENGEYVGLNVNESGGNHVYVNTLAHEMQHAIDFNSDNLDMDAINRMNALDKNTVSNMSVEEVEQTIAGGLTEYVKSEVNAHDRGNTIDASHNLYEDRLDANDGVYTYDEFDYVINKRGYETVYEDSLNKWLKETYGTNTNYRADVWVDRNGNIQVDIDQSRPLVPRMVDKINIPSGA